MIRKLVYGLAFVELTRQGVIIIAQNNVEKGIKTVANLVKGGRK